jgi:hypothetical protein
MSYGWMGNYTERQRPAKFIPFSGQPETVWPGRGFHADSGGGYGCDCVTSSRYDVLARGNPAWAATVLAAAVAAGMPLVARRVGSAGKYRFWLLCASNPAEAEKQSRRLKVEADAIAHQREAANLRQYHTLQEGSALVAPDGRVIQTRAASLCWHGWSGPQQMLLADGSIVPVPAGAALHDANGVEIAPYESMRSEQWLPSPSERADHADAWWWADTLAAREQSEIEIARAAKQARKIARTVAAPVEPQSPFAALAALRS